ncbi:MAG TPA: glycoside hydrolase family 38 C-terminal domain-containing protein, partial [Phycisphaerae bacterium]|nr:glycoside hydrolase family 38 C-terminal domain-containing protein [Phycisphaerae bacterium]
MGRKDIASRVTGHIITHNHWDRDWVLTEIITRKQAVGFFANLFKMMEREPEYRMVLDGQAEIIDDFLDELPPRKRPAAEKALAKHIGRGKLMAGPTYIQPDYVLVSGETHVRNLLIGHNVARKYGNVMKVGWLIDTFGHISQMPQLLNQFGTDSIFIARGFPIPPDEIMSEFTWSGPDGSTLLAVYTMNTSRNAMNLAQMPQIAENRIDIEIEKLTPLCIAPHIPLFNGFEQDQVIDDILPIVRNITAKDKPYHLRQTNPDEFFDIIKPALKRKRLPHCQGFLYSGIYMPLLHGTLSTRARLKLRNDTCEKLNEKWAEPLSALAWSRGDKYPAKDLERSWKIILKNDHHDDICGCCSDEVDIDMHKRYDQVEKISRGIVAGKMRRIVCNVDTRKAGRSGLALVAFNPANIERSDIVRTALELPKGFGPFRLVDERGRAVPLQVTKQRGRKTEIVFRPTLPPLGYGTVYLTPPRAGRPAPAAGVLADPKNLTAENEHLRIKVNANGSLDVTRKKTGKTHRQVGVLVDGGDMGDLYDYSYPPVDNLVSSKDCRAAVTLLEAGPLVARFRVEMTMKIPAALHKNRRNRTRETVDMPVVSIVELAAGSPRVDWTTRLTNTARDHRLRVHFPTGVKSDFSHAGESFDVNPFTYVGELWGIELPRRLRGLVVPGRDTVRIRSYPFHGFCDYSDGTRGVGVVAKGIREYEITKPRREIALTLLRSVGCMTHLDILTRNGDVGWEIYTPMGQCFGTYAFRYGFCPHRGDWFAGAVHTESELFNEPVRAVQTTAHP